MKPSVLACALLLGLTACQTATPPPAASTAAPEVVEVPPEVAAAALQNQQNINAIKMGQTFVEVQRIMGKGPERRHARLRFDGVAIEEWSYTSDPFRKLDTVITFIGGKVEEINTTSWERRKREADARQQEQPR
jgi:putative hemolysin